jgi:hypothetical protein
MCYLINIIRSGRHARHDRAVLRLLKHTSNISLVESKIGIPAFFRKRGNLLTFLPKLSMQRDENRLTFLLEITTACLNCFCNSSNPKSRENYDS